MKRIISFLLCVMLLASLAFPVSAASPEIIFTDESFHHPGFTMEVDKGATLESCYNNGTSDVYNAYLEGNVQYYWMRNDSYFADGPSLTIREEDRGCQFYCMAALYADADHTQQIGTIYSAKFSVPEVEKPTIPEITTTQLPNAVVGQEYYFRLECTDPDVTYSLFRSSLPDGLNLTQHGEIEGTPTKAGFWYVVIMATPEAGEDYANTAEFEFYVVEDGPDYTLEIMRLPKKTTYYQGEKLDMTGMWVRIWIPDGYLDSYDGKYLTYYDGTLDNLGERKINLKYEDAREPIYVTVIEAPKPTETEPKPTEPKATEPPATTVPPVETTEPSTTEAPAETTVPPTTAAPSEPAETQPIQPEPKPSGAPLALAFVGGGAATAGIGGLVLFLLKKKGGRK